MSLYKIMGWTLEQILWLNLIERLLLKLFVKVCLFVEFAKSHRSGANIRLYICSVCAKFQFAKSWFTMKWFAQRIPIENSRSFFNTTLIIYNIRFWFSESCWLNQHFDIGIQTYDVAWAGIIQSLLTFTKCHQILYDVVCRWLGPMIRPPQIWCEVCTFGQNALTRRSLPLWFHV